MIKAGSKTKTVGPQPYTNFYSLLEVCSGKWSMGTKYSFSMFGCRVGSTEWTSTRRPEWLGG